MLLHLPNNLNPAESQGNIYCNPSQSVTNVL